MDSSKIFGEPMKTLNVLTNAARAVGVALLLQVPAQAQTEWRFNNSYPASRPP